MKAIFPFILGALFALFFYHTLTYGRRGRRWGRTQ
jgi:hypothetical protein